MGPLMEIAMPQQYKSGKRHATAGKAIRGSQAVDSAFSGTPDTVISGSPIPEGTQPSAALLTAPPEDFAAFRGIAFSLAFEAALVGAGFALWEVWKLFR